MIYNWDKTKAEKDRGKMYQGLLKKSRLLRRYAPRNDTKCDFSVIARPAKQAVAISNLSSGLFQQPPGHL